MLLCRPLWLSYQSKCEEVGEERPLPPIANKFESYFTLLHHIPLATGVNDVICKDFFLATVNNLYGIFATSIASDSHAPAAASAVAGIPVIEKITFLIVRLDDGVITARSVFQDDYIHLAHNAGVFLHDDLLAILSVRFQRIHIKQIRDGGLSLDIQFEPLVKSVGRTRISSSIPNLRYTSLLLFSLRGCCSFLIYLK